MLNSHQKSWRPEGGGTTFLRFWKKCQPMIFYPVKISFNNEDKMKIFSEEGKVKEPMASQLTCSVRTAKGILLSNKRNKLLMQIISKRLYWAKEASLKRSHAIRFHLYDIFKNINLSVVARDWGQGRGKVQLYRDRTRSVSGSYVPVKYLYYSGESIQCVKSHRTIH